jgi:heat shock protein HslJ
VLLVCLALALGVAACGGDDDSSSGAPSVEGTPATAQDLEANPWQLKSYAVSGSDDLAGAQPSAPGTAQFGGGAATGSTGCNTYNAPYQIPRAGSIDFGAVAVTQAACGDPATTQQEQGMLGGFERASRVAMNDTDLQFLDDRNTPVLIFVKAEP